MAPAYWHNSGRSLVLPIFCLFVILLQVTSECDRTFVSRPGGPQNGTFTAPSFINPAGHSRQCIYTFVAGQRQRVELVFTSFNLRGTPPDGTTAGVLPACIHEYMDVYSEVQQPDASELVNSPFGGRYCGPIPPRRRISLYRALALGFYTDKNTSYPELFSGIYVFINDSTYEIGTPVPNTPCSFTVHAASKKQGMIVSPTYPGAYPKDLSCTYQFLGLAGQRIRIEFRDFDLFFGGPHCPFDYVKVYDGADNESAVIGTYCGQQRNLVLYSSESSLLVTFVTLQRTANTQNRGFKGIFEFSESFVKLDFIVKNDGEHIRGSECDQKILSKKESSGTVYSPNWPFPYIPKIVCRYFVYGMQDSQHLERVRLVFGLLDISKGNPKEGTDCPDGYLKIYLKGQETTDSYDKFDHEMCGEKKQPFVVVSDGPRLVMVFSSGELQGRGFKANYTFETEYRIPGTAAPDGTCNFTYRSGSRKKGEFNSPRYPSNYPSETNCTYLFVPTPNEQVTLVFDHFKVRADNVNSTVGSYGVSICQEDWLEMYNTYKDGTEKLVGRYCGMTAPGPIESNRGASGVKIILHSDQEGVFSGFKAHYTFESVKSIFGDCGSNVSGAESGVISSPNFPQNYDGPERGLASKTCNWYIIVRPKHKILLNFEFFAVEGEPSARGCPAAVLRLWYTVDGPPLELCGEKQQTDKWQFLSEGNSMRISFISAEKSVGAQGFRAVWTEVSEGPYCEQFTCAKSSFCISMKLICNRLDNCGADDQSDEMNCSVEVPVDPFKLVGVALCVGGVLVLGLCLWCHRKHRHRRRQIARLRRNTVGSSRRQLSTSGSSRRQHVCDELGERFASVDSV
ncbi:cubilin isoform X4 [Zootermopsis nevadensis]|uniref:cubilin isoform X4 n=1 Tax=Zootermopsis nevadensis TaxID=136037 RepID=UPI000B8E3F93|nr:cubilin isoform X4 [Zootermopsis nevadensis]